MNKGELREALREELEARAPVDKETHLQHHRFLEEMIQETKERKDRNKAIKKAVYIWGTLGFLSWLATFLHDKWHDIVQLFVSGN